MSTVLSIQSHVAYGHAGNSSAVFPLQRIGVEVIPVLTVNFSNNTSYESVRGPVISASDVSAVIQGVDERGALSRVDAVLSGFQGSQEIVQVTLDAVKLVKERNPEAIYCADPVMGDVGRGFYARPGIPEFIRTRIVPKADIMTPNLFELEFLSGRQTSSMSEVIEAANMLRSQGPETVLVTSVTGSDVPDNVLRMVAINSAEIWQVETPLLDRSFTGSGDLTAAIFLANLLRTGDLRHSIEQTAAVVYSVLEQTTAADSRELKLVAAQDQLITPDHVFSATVPR